MYCKFESRVFLFWSISVFEASIKGNRPNELEPLIKCMFQCLTFVIQFIAEWQSYVLQRASRNLCIHELYILSTLDNTIKKNAIYSEMVEKKNPLCGSSSFRIILPAWRFFIFMFPTCSNPLLMTFKVRAAIKYEHLAILLSSYSIQLENLKKFRIYISS